MVYEKQHSLNSNVIKVECGENLEFMAHFHDNFELISVIDGEMLITVGKTEYLVKEKESVLVFPNQVHSIKTPKQSKHLLCIFSPKLVSAYGKIYDVKIPKSNKFKLSEFYISKLLSCNENQSAIFIKGVLYLLCAEFDEQADYVAIQKNREDILFLIFSFVEQNYKKECSLYELAKTTSYNYVYLSKSFAKRTGMSYTEYVNRFRINEARYLLVNSDKSILEIALESGYESLRSFNRNFKKIMETTPLKYRTNKNY